MSKYFIKKENLMSLTTIQNALNSVREQKPLIVNITNYVVMNTTANALLAIGASPIMAHSQGEMSEMMAIADALVINIGTLDSLWIPRMRYAIQQANAFNKPIILDPVGCGATTLRTELAKELAGMSTHLIIRGNASELIAFSGRHSQTKGVDSQDSSDAAQSAAQKLIHDYQCHVILSGEIDFIISGTNQYSLYNGSSMMPSATGMGCTLSALTAAFAAVGENTGLAATAIMGIAGEIAAEKSAGPGSLQVNLIDTLYSMNTTTIANRLRMEKLAIE